MAMSNPVNITPQKNPSPPFPGSSQAPFPASPATQNLLQQQQQQQQQLLQHRPKRLLIFQETKSPALESAYAPVNALGLPIAGSGPYFPGCTTTVSNLPLKVIKSFTEVFNSPRYKNWFVFFFISVCIRAMLTGNQGLLLLLGLTMIRVRMGSFMQLFWSRSKTSRRKAARTGEGGVYID
jgi:hypothetical protein